MNPPNRMDRWERMVLNWWSKDLPEIDGPVLRECVARLLRKEHAAVVRMVKNALDESIARDLPETGPGYQCACRHILDQLKRRVK